MKILGVSGATVEEARAWAALCGGTPVFLDLAALYWRYAAERGVRPEVAYAQSAKETAFGRFGGVVDARFRNPCGMKVDGATGDEPADHQRFPTWDVGVIAHVDHLALYAGALGYPRVDTPDPRHYDFLLGQAETVESLGGRWAPAFDYGASLVESYVRPLLSTSVPAPDPAPEYALAAALEAVRVRDLEQDDELRELALLLADVQEALNAAGARFTNLKGMV